jgi:RNA ligase
MNQNFDLLHYFISNNLFEETILKDWCERHFVNYVTSLQFPGLVLLKYSDKCVWDNQWSNFSMSSRGTIVDLINKKLLAISKFFNMNQEPETAYDNLKGRKDFEVSEKLDGSCLVSFLNPNDNQFYLTTLGSFESEHGKVGTELFKKLPMLAYEYADHGTLIFELIDPRFRIVVDYSKKNYPSGLYLIGYRTREGRLCTYAEVGEIAKELGVLAPKTYKMTLDTILSEIESLSVQDEGFVLRYPEDELMVKIKGLKYLRAHRFISKLSDKNILEAVAEGVADPLVEIAPEEYREDVINKIAYFKSRKLDLVNQAYQYFADAPKGDRKTFALWVLATVKPELKGLLFNLYDGKQLQDKYVYDIISKIEKPSVETVI